MRCSSSPPIVIFKMIRMETPSSRPGGLGEGGGGDAGEAGLGPGQGVPHHEEAGFAGEALGQEPGAAGCGLVGLGGGLGGASRRVVAAGRTAHLGARVGWFGGIAG